MATDTIAPSVQSVATEVPPSPPETSSKSSEPERPCKLCRRPIPTGARLCAICGSYQNWLGGISRSGLVLSLLVALVSVSAVALPIFRTALRPARSEVRKVDYYYTDTGVSILLENKGSKHGFVSSCKMDVLDGSQYVWSFNFNLDSRSPTRVVPPDSVVEIFYRTDRTWMGKLLGQKFGSDWEKTKIDSLSTKLTIGIRQFDGSESSIDGVIAHLKDFYYVN